MPTPVTLYRVSYSVEGGNSGGYTWHTSRRSAYSAWREAMQADPDEYELAAGLRREDRASIEKLEVPRTKDGLVSFLAVYASHANNG